MAYNKRNQEAAPSEFVEKVVSLNRVARLLRAVALLSSPLSV